MQLMAKRARPAFQLRAIECIQAARKLRKVAKETLVFPARVRIQRLERSLTFEALSCRRCAHFCSQWLGN